MRKKAQSKKERAKKAVVMLNETGWDNKAYVRVYGVSASCTGNPETAIRKAGKKAFGHENFTIKEDYVIDVNKSLWVIEEKA